MGGRVRAAVQRRVYLLGAEWAMLSIVEIFYLLSLLNCALHADLY
jgi:hypothetical protein